MELIFAKFAAGGWWLVLCLFRLASSDWPLVFLHSVVAVSIPCIKTVQALMMTIECLVIGVSNLSLSNGARLRTVHSWTLLWIDCSESYTIKWVILDTRFAYCFEHEGRYLPNCAVTKNNGRMSTVWV